MSVGLIIALVLAAYVAYLMVRGQWSERVGLFAAVGLGVLIPQVLAALSTVAGSASALLSTTGW